MRDGEMDVSEGPNPVREQTAVSRSLVTELMLVIPMQSISSLQ